MILAPRFQTSAVMELRDDTVSLSKPPEMVTRCWADVILRPLLHNHPSSPLGCDSLPICTLILHLWSGHRLWPRCWSRPKAAMPVQQAPPLVHSVPQGRRHRGRGHLDQRATRLQSLSTLVLPEGLKASPSRSGPLEFCHQGLKSQFLA